MAELSVADVVAFTKGRLTDDGPTGETARMLAAALQAARRAVGWHVSPVLTNHTITLDGPGSRILWLPARKVVNVDSVTEDEVLLDADDYSLSAGDGPYRSRPLALRKVSGDYWTDTYGGIVVQLDFGYTEAEAADWRQAILSMVDRMGMAATGFDEANLTRKTIDDVTYQIANPYEGVAEEAVGSVSHVLCEYALPAVELI